MHREDVALVCLGAPLRRCLSALLLPDESRSLRRPEIVLRRDTDRTTVEDNIEVVRTAMDAWNRGDWDAALADGAPNFELDSTANRGDWRGVHRGADEVKRLWQAFTEPWESARIQIEEFIPAPGDAVVTRQTGYFLGRDGIEVTTHTGWAWQFHDGKLIRVLAFNDLDDALGAVGLSR